MTPKRQKGKGGKRHRAWHHGPLEDRRFDEAMQRLAQASASNEVDGVSTERTPTHKGNTTQKDGSHE
jgi:hypothetical protein